MQRCPAGFNLSGSLPSASSSSLWLPTMVTNGGLKLTMRHLTADHGVGVTQRHWLYLDLSTTCAFTVPFWMCLASSSCRLVALPKGG